MANEERTDRILQEHNPEILADKLEVELQQIRTEKQANNDQFPSHPGTPPPYPLEDK